MLTLADALRWRARRHPDLPASWFQGRTRTFGELNRSTTELAAGLVEAGIKLGDHVCVLDKNSDDYYELLVAITKCGVIATLVNWRLTASEVAKIADDVRCALMVAGEEVSIAGAGEAAGGEDAPRARRFATAGPAAGGAAGAAGAVLSGDAAVIFADSSGSRIAWKSVTGRARIFPEICPAPFPPAGSNWPFIPSMSMPLGGAASHLPRII